MDSLRNYEGFSEDIQQAFKKLTGELDLSFLKEQDGIYQLKNAFCILRFTLDRGDLSCMIKPISEAGYEDHINTVFNYLFPEDNSFDESLSIDQPYKQQLLAYAEICDRLKNVLLGDFSWREEYNMNQAKLNRMANFILNKIDKNSLMYKEFIKGNKNWVKDLEAYLRNNNISV